MKTLLIIALLSSTAVLAETNNAAFDCCLKQQQYTQQNFDNFDFGKLASCHHKTIAANVQKENDEIVALLREKPYYGGDGSGWYKSTEIYSTKRLK